MSKFGGLEQLLKIAKGSDDMRARMKAIGARLAEMEKTPGFYSTGSHVPPSTLEELQLRHGIKPVRIKPPDLAEFELLGPGQPDYSISVFPGSEIQKEHALGHFPTTTVRDLYDLIYSGKNYGVIGSIGSTQGMGVGSKGTGAQLYPAMMDFMNISELDNLSDPYGITSINNFRRPMNMMAPMLRNRNVRVYPNKSEISEIGIHPKEFVSLPREDQAGGYMLEGTLKGLKALGKDIGFAKNIDPDWEKELQGWAPGFLRLGNLGPDSTLADVRAEHQFLRDHGVTAFGQRSIQRALVLDALMRGAEPHPSLLSGLGHRRGGLVQIRDTQSRT